MQPSGHLAQQFDLGNAGAVGLWEDHDAVSGADAVPGLWKLSAKLGCSVPSANLPLLSLEASWQLPACRASAYPAQHTPVSAADPTPPPAHPKDGCNPLTHI